jgi:hypothetical protein
MHSYLKHVTRQAMAGAITVIVGSSIGMVLPAFAAVITPPVVPPAIDPAMQVAPGTPPPTLFLVGQVLQGFGTQGYTCLPSFDLTTGGVTGFNWTPKSRPEATLFSNGSKQIVTHFLSPNPSEFALPPEIGKPRPTWQSSKDSSLVWGNKVASVDAGPGVPSCPNLGAIPCLLLKVVGTQAGPTGGTQLSLTTYIQRLNTFGGSAPPTGCAAPTDVGKTVLIPYTADYYFYQ